MITGILSNFAARIVGAEIYPPVVKTKLMFFSLRILIILKIENKIFRY